MNPSKFRSPYRDIDLKLLRELCNLHPWTMMEICQYVGIGRSVLTNVFSGQRPIPTRVAQKFLDFVGMQPDGSLDREHAFILQERPGNEEALADLFKRIFPTNRAGSVKLIAPGVTESGEQDPLKPRSGTAYFDGQFAAVVHGINKVEPASHSDEKWKMIDVSSSDILLSKHPLPTKLDVLRKVSVADFQIQITWDQVILASKAKGLDASDVLQFINGMPSRKKSVC